MEFDLDQGSSVPVYQQIVDEVQRRVSVGVLRPEDPLPAARSLAQQLRINPNTVQHAYRTLEQAGLVRVRRGLGTFVAAQPRVDPKRQAAKAREIAERMLREGYRHGLLASDLIAALRAIAPRPDGDEPAADQVRAVRNR